MDTLQKKIGEQIKQNEKSMGKKMNNIKEKIQYIDVITKKLLQN